VDRGERAGNNALGLDPSIASTYVLLTSLYEAAKQFDKAKAIREKMQELGIKKIPGTSSVELQGKTAHFVVEDYSHEFSDQIHALAKDFHQNAVKLGYKPDLSCVTRDVPNDQKEELLQLHR
jgi:hypothetical protein